MDPGLRTLDFGLRTLDFGLGARGLELGAWGLGFRFDLLVPGPCFWSSALSLNPGNPLIL